MLTGLRSAAGVEARQEGDALSNTGGVTVSGGAATQHRVNSSKDSPSQAQTPFGPLTHLPLAFVEARKAWWVLDRTPSATPRCKPQLEAFLTLLTWLLGLWCFALLREGTGGLGRDRMNRRVLETCPRKEGEKHPGR